MNVWLTKAAMLAACALVGVASAVATVIVAGDKLIDVDGRIDSAVARETDAAVAASRATERERSDKIDKAFVAFASGMDRRVTDLEGRSSDVDRRVTDLEGRSYRLTDFLCGALDGQSVVTGVQLIPLGLGQQQLDVTTATICVEEE